MLFRLAAFVAFPVYEDDFYRYLWDGYQLLSAGNPYGTPPADFFGDLSLPAGMQLVLDQVNYPSFPTAYGPTLQYFFGLAALLQPGSLVAWQGLLFVFEFIVLTLLCRALLSRDSPIPNASNTQAVAALLLYAWSPLLIFVTGVNAHAEIIAVGFMVFAWIAFGREQKTAAFLLLALAAGAKVFALLAVPFFLWRQPIRYWVIFGVGLTALYLPFLLQGSLAGLEGTLAMGQLWEFNSLGYALFSEVWPFGEARFWTQLLTLMGLVMIWEIWRRRVLTIASAVQCCLGWFFWWSPVINPWYLLWFFPWVVIRPSYTALTALSVIFLSYATYLNLGQTDLGSFEHALWIRWLQGTLIAAALVYDAYRFRMKTSRTH
ncbi:MAG: hypothetical protein AAGH72_06160 [Verrucomicrobiota bacterium]